MAVDLNVNPYYDDFDEFKNFHQLLFRPGYAVQARELTQLQTILQNQIGKFGKHIFKHGSVVIPGNTLSELYVPYIKAQPTFNGLSVNPLNFNGDIIVGTTSAIRAKVKTYAAQTSTDPLTFYLTYLSGGGENATSNLFQQNEILYLENDPTVKFQILDDVNYAGLGSLSFIKRGVYFVSGRFVSVDDQTVVISRYTTTPSCHVLLQIDESVVTPNEDSTLLDPAQGSYNFAAPGSDRLKVALTLTTLPLGSNINENYIELMRYNQGVLELHTRYPLYSELEKSLARRTFDESGNYVVTGFESTLREHLRTNFNNGVYLEDNVSTPGDLNKFVVEVSPGRAYINGLEVESIAPKLIEVNKARTSSKEKFTFKNNYGKYIYVSGMTLLPNFTARQLISFYDTSATTGGTLAGTARALAIDYVEGLSSTDSAIYKLYIDDLEFKPGFTLQSFGGGRFSSGVYVGNFIVTHKFEVPSPSADFEADEIVTSGGVTRSGTVRYYSKSQGIVYVHKHSNALDIPVKGDYITGATSTAKATVAYVESTAGVSNPLIVEIPQSYVKTTGTGVSSAAYDTTYITWKTFVIDPLDANGAGNKVISDGEFISPEVGTIVAVSNDAVPGPKIINISDISLLTTPTTLEINAGLDYAGASVVVCAQVRKTQVQPRTKTLTTRTLSNVSPATEILLDKADIYELVSIVTTSGEDVTNYYVLDDGQTDLYYGLGKLRLLRSLPSENLNITFQYFEHSAGDYFSVDSYKTLGANDEHIPLVPSYVSKTTSKKFFLGNCLDFRPVVDSSGSFDSSVAEPPVVDSFVQTTAGYFIPRTDILYVEQSGRVNIKTGTPSQTPVLPRLPANSIPLKAFYIDAYTESLDNVLGKSFNNYRYTMSDIKKLENRIKDLEYYTQLNSIESSILSYKIIDAETGIDKFKSGYVVDNFQTYDLVCDYFNRENRCSFWGNNLTAPTEDFEGVLTLLESNSTNYKNTNGIITLPYSIEKFIEQPVSSRVENLNPFLVINWTGEMTISPSKDVWIETQDLPSVSISNTSLTTYSRRRVLDFEVWPAAGIRRLTADTGWEVTNVTTSYTNVKAPPVGNIVTLAAYAGVLGLVSSPNDPKWFYVVRFTVPSFIADQNLPALRLSGSSGKQVIEDWSSYVTASNNAFNSALSSNVSELGLNSSQKSNTSLIIGDFSDQVDYYAPYISEFGRGPEDGTGNF